MMTTTEQKEIVWLPASLAKKVKDLTDAKELEQVILGFVQETKLSLHNDLECLDDEIIRYKASMIKAKNAFKEAKDEQLDAMYKLWEGYDEEISGIRTKINSITEQIKPLKSELQDLKKLMGDVATWDIEKLLQILKDVNNHLGYNNETGSVLKFLFDNYKRPTS